MTSISGTIRLGEATPTVKATAQRQRGSNWWYYGLMLALIIGTGLVGMALAAIADFDPVAGYAIGAITGLVIYTRWCKLLAVWRFRKTLTARGVPLDLPVRFEVAPDALTYEIGGVRMVAQWSAVSEVFHDKGWWIVMVQSDPWFAADRFFASDEDKRAFLRELLSHMSDEARARSPAAVRVAEGAA